MPARVTCDEVVYQHVKTFKHDFFAATGVYRGPDGLAVLKMGRRTAAWTIPLDWIGRFLTAREVHMYLRLSDLPGVPRMIGVVGRNRGFLHDFVPGHPLGRDEDVSDTFFDELRGMLDTLQQRGMAYVDLNKRQNVLMGDDQRPYLIDFQISLDLPRSGWSRNPLAQWILRRFQNADDYHFLKHKRRLRPDLLTPEEVAAGETLGFWIRLHRTIARPLTRLRRRTLKRLARSEDVDVVGSEAK